MKQFLLKTGVAAGLAVALHLLAGLMADGWTDAYYLRFTGERQQNLILGTSRAAQGISPAELNAELDRRFFNFGFTGMTSPYGEVYLRATLEKLDPAAGDGMFILAVDPWGLSSLVDSKTGEERLPEETEVLNEICSFNATPNYEYLVREYSAGWGRIILNSLGFFRSELYLHDTGWLEVERPTDTTVVAERTLAKLKSYRESLPRRLRSQTRLAGLEHMIDTLQRHGKVFLVRLPVSQGFRELEEEYWPDFDQLMEDIAARHDSVPYLRMQDELPHVQFTDGNHIARGSAGYCAQRIAGWIASQQEGNAASPVIP
jgi:hypothetical protein